jgi:hypothetical protein
VRKPAASGLTSVTFRTAAVAPGGISLLPATVTAMVPLAVNRVPLFWNPLHWASPLVRFEGFPALVSQSRAEIGSGL